MSQQEAFHAHLDKCSQCRNNPFGLCSVGHQLLCPDTHSAITGFKTNKPKKA